jgi:hypothetical protein
VDRKLWTDESVFWQGKLEDRGEYMVIHSKPTKFQRWLSPDLSAFDREKGVVYDTDVELAPPVPKSMPPKIEVVYGPTRLPHDRDVPWECGTNWGDGDWRTGLSWNEVEPEDRFRWKDTSPRPARYDKPPVYRPRGNIPTISSQSSSSTCGSISCQCRCHNRARP